MSKLENLKAFVSDRISQNQKEIDRILLEINRPINAIMGTHYEILLERVKVSKTDLIDIRALLNEFED